MVKKFIKSLCSLIPLVMWMPFIVNASMIDAQSGYKVRSQGIQLEAQAGIEEADKFDEHLAVVLLNVEFQNHVFTAAHFEIEPELEVGVVYIPSCSPVSVWYRSIPHGQSPPSLSCIRA